MAKVIGIMGESGAGKTSSLRNLDPKTTFYFDCDEKGLNWKGWKEQYSVAKKNYWQTTFPSVVMQTLEKIDKDKDKQYIKTVVVDTLNGIMLGEEQRERKTKGYDKWTDLAGHIYDIIKQMQKMRDDLTIIVLCHSETVSDDNGQVFTRIKTNGRKLEKIVLESLMTTVVYATHKDGKYVFRTRQDNCTCKAPMGAFEEDEIDNDIVKVVKALEEY